MAEKRLKASIIIGGALDSTLRAALASTKKSFLGLGDAINKARRQEKDFKKEIDGLKATGRNVEQLEKRYDRVRAAIKRTETAQHRLRVEEQRRHRIRETAGRVRGVGIRAGVGAVAGGAFIGSTITAGSALQAETTRLKLLGASGEDKLRAIEFGRALKNFGTSQTENVELIRDALAVFGQLSESKAVTPLMSKLFFANRALYGTSQEEAEAQFQNMLRVIDVRGGTNSVGAYQDQAEHIQRAITASGNRVTSTDWREVVQRGGLAAKGLTNDALFYQLLPLVQEMGGSQVGTALASSYQNLYQGKTTKRAAQNLEKYGLIGDTSKVKYDKTGQTAQLNPGALLGADIFRRSQFDWVTQVLLPQLKKKGITDGKQIADIIGSIVTNRTGANLLATMVLQRGIIERDAGLAAQAGGIDATATAARGTSAGQRLALHANVENFKLGLGDALTPTFISILGKVNSGIEKLNGFIKENPRLARNATLGIIGITTALAVTVPVLTVAGLAMNAYAGFALLAAKRTALLTTAQLEETVAAEAATAAEVEQVAVGKAASLGLLARFNPLRVMKGLFGSLGLMIRGVGAALLGISAPVTAAVVAFGAAAFAIRKYWEPIRAFFKGFTAGFAEAFAPILPQFKAIFGPIGDIIKSVWNWFKDLLKPVHLTTQGLKDSADAGKNFGKILGDAITYPYKMYQKLYDIIKKVFHLSTKTPEAVVSKNLSDTQQKKLTMDWWNGAMAGGGNAPPAFSTSALSNVRPVVNQTHTYHITQQPGQSSEELAGHIIRLSRARQGVPLSDGAD